MSPAERRFARFTLVVLAANLLVILWGAYVRATGSGAGCGSHWPLCNGEVIPRAPSVATLIEYSHRTTSGLALLLVVAMLVAAHRLYPKGHQVRLGAWSSFVLILTEAGVGAGLVLFELVADNESMARAMFMGVHLTNTLLLVGAMTLTSYWAFGGAAVRLRRDSASRLALATGAALLLVGLSGAISALGNTLYPTRDALEGLGQHLSASSQILLQLRSLHPFLAIGGACLVLYYIARVRALKQPQPSRRFANLLNGLIFVQVAAGGLNMFLHAPIWMQLLHLLLADFVWISYVLTTAATFTADQESPATAARRAPAAYGGAPNAETA